MSSECPYCRAGLGCKDHPDAPRCPPPPVYGTSNEPEPPSKLPKSFRFYQPAHPLTLSKPWSEHSDGEKARIIASHPPAGVSSGGAKRKSDEAPKADTHPAPKRRVPEPQTFGVVNSAPRQLRSAAYDVYRCVIGCNDQCAPVDVNLDETIDDDIIYQHSKPLEQFRRPLEQYLRCIHCMRNSGIWRTWKNRDGGTTGRIREHMQKCHAEEFLPKVSYSPVHLAIKGDTAKMEYSPRSFSECLARWMAVDDQAMNVVESKEFRQLLVLASQAPKLTDDDIPHRKKITKTIGELYIAEKERIKHALKNARGQISITSDLWSDGNLRAFMAVTAHYINQEGYLAEHLIAFRRIKGHHTGVNMGQVFFSILEEFEIVEKLGYITLDNASSNDTLMAELERVFQERGLIAFGRTLNRIRCFPHVLNLSVNSVLTALPAAAKWYRDEADKKGETLDDEVIDYLVALESGLVNACRESVKAMRKSDLRRDGFSESIKLGNLHGYFKTKNGETLLLPVLQLLRDSETRWSSTYNMIKRYLELYPAVIRFSATHPEMQIPVISQRQYEVLHDLLNVLAVLHSAQELLSAERTPTLSLALPVYEGLIQALKDCKIAFPVLQHAVESGIQKLEAYVAKTRGSPVYAYSMAVNPCMKFRWIDQHWDRIARNTARLHVKEKMFEIRKNQYKSSPTAINRPQTEAERAAQAQQNGYMRVLTLGSEIRLVSSSSKCAYHKSPTTSSNPMPEPSTSPSLPLSSQHLMKEGDLLVRCMAEVDAELLRWEALDNYNADMMGTVTLVDFWKAHRYDFPLLYEIAMDVLPVQASSVSSERAFSSSKMTCTRERNKISAESMEYLQVLKHSLHRRRSTDDNNQTLDFMVHVVGSDIDEED
ncbi:hAT family dimerization protein [Ceratobasidium sp. AG-Ba]|nr:hAT family dimerization protein [Ceratobasidium sp. AG-Ba]